MVTHEHTSTPSLPGRTRANAHTLTGLCSPVGGPQRSCAQREEAERRCGAKLREDSPQDGENGGEGGCPPAANQGQEGHRAAELRER